MRGRVRGPDGTPVAGARVVIVRSPVPVPEIAALTGADGTFEIDVPVGGSYTLAAHADAMAGSPAMLSVTVPTVPAVMPGGARGLDLEAEVSSEATAPVDADFEAGLPTIDVLIRFEPPPP